MEIVEYTPSILYKCIISSSTASYTLFLFNSAMTFWCPSHRRRYQQRPRWCATWTENYQSGLWSSEESLSSLSRAGAPTTSPGFYSDFIYIANDLMTCECQRIKLQDTADFSIFCPVSSLFLLFFFLFCLFLFQIAIVFALILHFFFFARPPLKKSPFFLLVYKS